MNQLKHINLLLLLVLIASLTSCKEEYPDLEDGLYAEFVTNKDTMIAKLFFDKTPLTVANFVALAEGNHPMVDSTYRGKHFYDSLTFHRVMDKFMIQGGDPTATGTGSPGYKFADEFDESLRHNKPGILSMANGGPATNGSQFFITEVPTPWLDNKHSIFGELVKGLDVQDSISNVKVGAGNKPLEDVIILELNIIRKGFDARKFDAPKTWESELKVAEEKEAKRQEEARIKAEEATKLAKEQAEIAKEKFLTENENLKGHIKRFPTGLTMIYTHQANGLKPSSTESALISYAVFLEDGQIIATNIKDVAIEYNIYNEQADQQGNYKPFSMIYNETATLIPGFREAMLNMSVGDKARVFIPSYLAYGPQGSRGVIPPDANLTFDIEIAGIKK